MDQSSITGKKHFECVRSKMRTACELDETEKSYAIALSRLVAKNGSFPTTGIAKLLNHLYLGSNNDARGKSNLRRLGITHILNTIDGTRQTTTSKDFYRNEFEYFGFSSMDTFAYPIMDHFDEAFKFIEAARISGGRCLIHCRSGINRSGALAVGYVMMHNNIGPISATRLVLSQRGIVLNNNGFVQRVVKFASERNMLEKDKDEVTSVTSLPVSEETAAMGTTLVSGDIIFDE